ncbi:MAG: alpha/beta fold hydrolase [Elusimicrobia bacterium]|nr:alpha/beta fold hydrolase [Elusimicrobiota bacterium]
MILPKFFVSSLHSVVRIVGALSCVLGFLYLTLCAFLYFGQERLLFFPQKVLQRLVYPFRGFFEEIFIEVPGARLNAVLFRAERSRGVVLYFHGNAGSLLTWEPVRWPFLTAGYDVLLMDYRGYGKSTGKIQSETQFLGDADAVYAWAKARYSEDRILLCGRSLGSGVAAHLARKNSPRLLLLESAYFSLLDMKRRLYPFVPDFLVRYQLRSDLWLREVRCPVSLIHGRADALVPHDSSVQLWPLIPRQGLFFLIDGAGHDDLSEFKEHDDAVAEILRQP